MEIPAGFQPAGRAPAPPPLDLVQDFVNTEIPVWSIDELATPASLAAWLEAHGLDGGGGAVDGESFVRARALRTFLRELGFRNTRGPADPDALRATLAAAASRARLRVGVDESGALRLEPEGDGVDAALATILIRVFDAQASGAWRRMKACPGPHCGWLFYDASRNVSSTWCSMSICGNRTKTAAYRRRRREPA